jgi:hypothetical protein
MCWLRKRKGEVHARFCELDELGHALAHPDHAVDAPQLVVVPLLLRDPARLLEAIQRVLVLLLGRGKTCELMVMVEGFNCGEINGGSVMVEGG